MATKYFENFPIVDYDGKKVRDITRRNTFLKSITTNPMLFLPYTVKQNERAEDVAQFYYGSVIHTMNGLWTKKLLINTSLQSMQKFLVNLVTMSWTGRKKKVMMKTLFIIIRKCKTWQ
jgi:hypothetical protein